MVLNKTSLHVLALTAAVCMMAGCDESNSGSGNNNDNNNVVCNAGDQRCINNNVMECKDNDWAVKTPCSNVQKCDPTSFTCKDNIVHVCDEGEAKCDKDGNVWVPKYCEQNAWKDRERCKENQNCDGTNGKCVDPVCTTGITCEGDKLVECTDAGAKNETNCASEGKICSETAHDCVEPPKDNNCTIDGTTKLNDGQTVCHNSRLYTCNKGTATPEDCESSDEVCREGQPSCSKKNNCTVGDTVIKSGELGCDLDKNVVSCDDGFKKVTETCTDGKSCQQDSADHKYKCLDEQPNSCTSNGQTIPNGKSVCVGTVIKTCNAGTLNNGDDCANVSGKNDCKDGVCVAKSCKGGTIPSGTKYCNDDQNKIMLCTNGEETEVSPCGTGEVCQPGATPECKSVATVKKYTKIQDIHADFDTIAAADPRGCQKSDGKSFMQRADVTVTGVVTGVKSNGFIIQDPESEDGKYAGIMVHCINTNCDKSDFGTAGVKLGNNVSVTASYVGHNYCQLWVRGDTKDSNSIIVKKTNENKNIQPITKTIAEINEGEHNPYNGTMVKVVDVVVGECDTSGSLYCNIRDSSEKEIPVTNYIYNNTVSELKDKSIKGKYLDITGIGHFHSTLLKASLGNLSNKSYKVKECTGTQTKCENNSLFTCSSGKWPETGEACPTANLPANSKVACSSDGTVCSFSCLYGDMLENNTCPEQSSGASCTDYYSATIKHNNRGCTTKSKYAVCNNGNWGTATECPDPGIENADPLCKPDGACGFECKPGFTPNGNKCVKSVYDSCTDEVFGGTVNHGEYGCTAENKHAICNDGHWEHEETCPNPGFEHASSVCSMYDGSCEIVCEGELVPNSTNTACIEDKAPCAVSAGVEANHGDVLCFDTFNIGTCNDGSWTNRVPCSNGCELGATSCNSTSSTTCPVGSDIPDAHEGDVVCLNSTSLATCHNGSWTNQQPCSNGCVVGASACNEAPAVTCKIPGHPDSHDGDVACYNYTSLGTCTAEGWGNPQSCEYGCKLGANACNGAPVTWCQFKHLESNGSAAYVRFKPPVSGTPYVVVYCADRSDSSAYPIVYWDDIRTGYDATYNCNNCGVNKEWKFEGFPTDVADTDCVAVVYNINSTVDLEGTGVVCPNTDVSEASFNAASRVLTDEKMATSAEILSYRGTGEAPIALSLPLAEWNFNASTLDVTGGLLKTGATFSLANSSATLKYKNHGDSTDKAVYTSGWSKTVNLANSAHYLVSMSTKGYRNIKISFDSSVSNKTDASVKIAYKTTASDSFKESTISMTYTDTEFQTLDPARLPVEVENADTLYIGIFPSTNAAATTVSLDNLVITGEKM